MTALIIQNNFILKLKKSQVWFRSVLFLAGIVKRGKKRFQRIWVCMGISGASLQGRPVPACFERLSVKVKVTDENDLRHWTWLHRDVTAEQKRSPWNAWHPDMTNHAKYRRGFVDVGDIRSRLNRARFIASDETRGERTNMSNIKHVEKHDWDLTALFLRVAQHHCSHSKHLTSAISVCFPSWHTKV